MKKQSNLPAGSRKLSLSKKTISNLSTTELSRQMGGGVTKQGCSGYCSEGCSPTYTCKSFCGGHGHTCNKPCGY